MSVKRYTLKEGPVRYGAFYKVSVCSLDSKATTTILGDTLVDVLRKVLPILAQKKGGKS